MAMAPRQSGAIVCGLWLVLCLHHVAWVCGQPNPDSQAAPQIAVEQQQEEQQQCSISVQVMPVPADATALCPTLGRLSTALLLVQTGLISADLVTDQLAAPFTGCAEPTSTEVQALSVRATFSNSTASWSDLDAAFQDGKFAAVLSASLGLECPSNITMRRICSSPANPANPLAATTELNVEAVCSSPTTKAPAPKPPASSLTTATITLSLAASTNTGSKVRPTAASAKQDCDTLAVLCNTQLNIPGLSQQFRCMSTTAGQQLTVAASFVDDARGSAAQQLQAQLSNQVIPALQLAYGVYPCEDELTLRFTGRQSRRVQLLGGSSPACQASSSKTDSLLNTADPSLFAVKLRVLRKSDAAGAAGTGGVSDEAIANILFRNDQASLSISAYTLLLNLDVPPSTGWKPNLCNQSLLMVPDMATQLQVTSASISLRCPAPAKADLNVQSVGSGSRRRLSQVASQGGKCDPDFVPVVTISVQVQLAATGPVSTLQTRASTALSRAWARAFPTAPCPPRVRMSNVYHELQLAANPFPNSQELRSVGQELATAKPTLLSLTVGPDGRYVSYISQDDLKLLADASGSDAAAAAAPSGTAQSGAQPSSASVSCPSGPVLWPLVFLGLGVGFLLGAGVVWLRMSQVQWAMTSSTDQVWKSSRYRFATPPVKPSAEIELYEQSPRMHQDITVRVVRSCTTGGSDGMATVTETRDGSGRLVDTASSPGEHSGSRESRDMTQSSCEGLVIPHASSPPVTGQLEPQVLLMITPAHTDPSLNTREASSSRQSRQQSSTDASCVAELRTASELLSPGDQDLQPSPFTAPGVGLELCRAGVVPEAALHEDFMAVPVIPLVPTASSAPTPVVAPVVAAADGAAAGLQPRGSADGVQQSSKRVRTSTEIVHSDVDEDDISWLPPPPAPDVQTTRSLADSTNSSQKCLSMAGSGTQSVPVIPSNLLDAFQRGGAAPKLKEASSGSVSGGTGASELRGAQSTSPTLTPVDSEMSLDYEVLQGSRGMPVASGGGGGGRGEGQASAVARSEIPTTPGGLAGQLSTSGGGGGGSGCGGVGGGCATRIPRVPSELSSPKTPEVLERTTSSSRVSGIGKLLPTPGIPAANRGLVVPHVFTSRLSHSSRALDVGPGTVHSNSASPIHQRARSGVGAAREDTELESAGGAAAAGKADGAPHAPAVTTASRSVLRSGSADSTSSGPPQLSASTVSMGRSTCITSSGSTVGHSTSSLHGAAVPMVVAPSPKDLPTPVASSPTAGTLTTPPGTDESDVHIHAELGPVPSGAMPPPPRSVLRLDDHLVRGDNTPNSTGSPRSPGLGGNRLRSGKVQPFQRQVPGSFVRVPVSSPLRSSHDATHTASIATRTSWASVHSQQLEPSAAGMPLEGGGNIDLGPIAEPGAGGQWNFSELQPTLASTATDDHGEIEADPNNVFLPFQQPSRVGSLPSRLPAAPGIDQPSTGAATTALPPSSSARHYPLSKPLYVSGRMASPGRVSGIPGLSETRALQSRYGRWKGLSSDSKIQQNPAFDP